HGRASDTTAKLPKYTVKSPKSAAKDPKYSVKDAKYNAKDPKYNVKDSKYSVKDAKYGRKTTKLTVKPSKFSAKDAKCTAKSSKSSSRSAFGVRRLVAALQSADKSAHSKAAIRKGPPLPPAIFIGIAITKKPSAGNELKSARFSKAGIFGVRRLVAALQSADKSAHSKAAIRKGPPLPPVIFIG